MDTSDKLQHTQPYQLSPNEFRSLLEKRIESLDFGMIQQEVEPYVKKTKKLEILPQESFMDITTRIKIV